MKVYDEKLKAVRKSKMRLSSPFNPSSGFCTLCWRLTEAQMAKDKIFIKRRGGYVEVPRPTPTPETLAEARRRLEELKQAARGRRPDRYGELLYLYARGHDHRLLYGRGGGSEPASEKASDEMLLDVIERNLLEERWLSSSPWFLVGRKHYQDFGLLGETKFPESHRYPVKASTKLCYEHNPRRSLEARRRYQRDLQRKDMFHELIGELTRHYISQGFGIHTEADRAAIRTEAYKYVCMSTLEMVKLLQAKGVKNLAEIGRRLHLSMKAISMTLIRSRQAIPTS
jgi:hypothetical protein